MKRFLVGFVSGFLIMIGLKSLVVRWGLVRTGVCADEQGSFWYRNQLIVDYTILGYREVADCLVNIETMSRYEAVYKLFPEWGNPVYVAVNGWGNWREIEAISADDLLHYDHLRNDEFPVNPLFPVEVV